MASVCVTHIVWASTNHQWGMKKTPTDGSSTLFNPQDEHKQLAVDERKFLIELNVSANKPHQL